MNHIYALTAPSYTKLHVALLRGILSRRNAGNVLDIVGDRCGVYATIIIMAGDSGRHDGEGLFHRGTRVMGRYAHMATFFQRRTLDANACLLRQESKGQSHMVQITNL